MAAGDGTVCGLLEGGASLVESSLLSDLLLTSLRLGVADLEELLEPKKLRISIFSTGTKTLNFEIL